MFEAVRNKRIPEISPYEAELNVELGSYLAQQIFTLRAEIKECKNPTAHCANLLATLKTLSELDSEQLFSLIVNGFGIKQDLSTLERLHAVYAVTRELMHIGFFFVAGQERQGLDVKKWEGVVHAADRVWQKIASNQQLLEELRSINDLQPDWEVFRQQFVANLSANSQDPQASAELEKVDQEIEQVSKAISTLFNAHLSKSFRVSRRDRDLLEGLSPAEIATAEERGRLRGGGFSFPRSAVLSWYLNPAISSKLVDRAVRKLNQIKLDPEFSELAGRLLELRKQEAKLSGFNSYLELAWARNGNLIQDPARLVGFIERFKEHASARLRELMPRLSELQERKLGLPRAYRVTARFSAQNSAAVVHQSAQEAPSMEGGSLFDFSQIKDVSSVDAAKIIVSHLAAMLNIAVQPISNQNLAADELLYAVADKNGSRLGELLVDVQSTAAGTARASLLKPAEPDSSQRRAAVVFGLGADWQTVPEHHLRVLFHELGHAFSYLLNQEGVAYQGGTGVPRDCNELVAFAGQTLLAPRYSGLGDPDFEFKQAVYALSELEWYGPNPPVQDLWHKADGEFAEIFPATVSLRGVLGPLFVFTRNLNDTRFIGNYSTYALGMLFLKRCQEKGIELPDILAQAGGSSAGREFLTSLLS